MEVQVVEVARLQAKDAQAFHSLIERLQQPITGYLYRLVGDYEVALDLAQDTFLQVFKEIGKTSADLALDAWIYRIATNYGLQYLNRKRRRQFVRIASYFTNASGGNACSPNEDSECSAYWHPSLTGPSIEDQAETRILVEQALSSLKPKDAACLQLHYGDGLTYEQIGKLIDITPEAARKRVARGVGKFRAVYGKDAAELPISQNGSSKSISSSRKR
jgi:RNA polymerase sigma-70 factor (ECF subfamily)